MGIFLIDEAHDEIGMIVLVSMNHCWSPYRRMEGECVLVGAIGNEQ